MSNANFIAIDTLSHTIIAFGKLEIGMQFTSRKVSLLLLATRPEAPVNFGTEALIVINIFCAGDLALLDYPSDINFTD